MGEVASNHVVQVAFVDAVQGQREVVHVREHVVRGPHQIQAVEEGVQGHDQHADVVHGQLFQKPVNLSVELIIEEPLRNASPEQRISSSLHATPQEQVARCQLGYPPILILGESIKTCSRVVG